VTGAARGAGQSGVDLTVEFGQNFRYKLLNTRPAGSTAGDGAEYPILGTCWRHNAGGQTIHHIVPPLVRARSETLYAKTNRHSIEPNRGSIEMARQR